MARVDQDPNERDKHPLQLPALLECPICVTLFDHIFSAPPGIFEMEDLVDAPEEVVTCPGCDYEFEATYEGWIAHEDAG